MRARAFLAISIAIAGFPAAIEQFAGLRAAHFSDLAFRQRIALSTSDVTTDALLADVPGDRYGPFSVEWSGYVQVRRAGRYSFLVVANGHSAVIVNGRKVSGDLDVGNGAGVAEPVDLPEGPAALVVRHSHEEGPPMIALLSALEGDTPRKVPLLSLTRTRRSPAPLELALLLKPLALPILALWGLYAATWIVRRTAAPAVGITAGVTALFAAAVIYDQPIWLRGPAPSPEGWRWSYQVRFPGLTEAVFSGLERTGIERAQVTGGRTIDDALLVAAIVGGFGLACSAALTLWPVTAIAWAAGADLTTAAQVGVLSTFIPAPVLFSPQFDQMVTLLVAAACAFACVAMRSTGRTARAGAALAAGAVAGAAVFCSFGAVPMLATGGVLAVLVAPKSLRTWRAIGEVAVVAVLGLSVVSLLPILSGYDFFLTMREALGVSRYQYEVKRSYSLWLRFNLLDFMYFFGPPLVAWGP